MIKTLIDLRRQVLRQESMLNTQRGNVAARYDALKMHYRRRLSSPTVLATSFAAGVAIGILHARPRHRTASKSERAPPLWLSAARTVAGPALLYVLRAKATEMFVNTKHS